MQPWGCGGGGRGGPSRPQRVAGIIAPATWASCSIIRQSCGTMLLFNSLLKDTETCLYHTRTNTHTHTHGHTEPAPRSRQAQSKLCDTPEASVPTHMIHHARCATQPPPRAQVAWRSRTESPGWFVCESLLVFPAKTWHRSAQVQASSSSCRQSVRPFETNRSVIARPSSTLQVINVHLVDQSERICCHHGWHEWKGFACPWRRPTCMLRARALLLPTQRGCLEPRSSPLALGPSVRSRRKERRPWWRQSGLVGGRRTRGVRGARFV